MTILAGETHTGLLLHSRALTRTALRDLLALSPGEQVLLSTRPTLHATSPDLLTGLDCRLPTDRRIHAVGTARGHAVVVGGLLAQATTVTEPAIGPHRQRMPWSHYLTRPGVLETIGSGNLTGLASRFLDTDPTEDTLDLGGISRRTLSLLHASPGLDKRPPIRTEPTRLRWIAELGPATEEHEVTFTVKDSPLRTLRLRCPDVSHAAIVELCEDIAAHDWLLTTVLSTIERAGIGQPPRHEVVDRLQPIVDHIIPLWMPAARTDVRLAPLWQRLENRPGFTRQWDNLVQRIRDQFTAATVSAMYRTEGVRPSVPRTAASVD